MTTSAISTTDTAPGSTIAAAGTMTASPATSPAAPKGTARPLAGHRAQSPRLAHRLAASVAGGLVVALAGCGTAGTRPHPGASQPRAASATTNGLERQSGAQVARAAAAAFTAAPSVHIRGTFYIAARTGYAAARAEKFDLRYDGSAVTGIFTINGIPIHITTIARRAWIKANERGWKSMGNKPGIPIPVNQWVPAGSARQVLSPFNRTGFASELTTEQSAHGGPGAVTQAELAGHQTVLVTYPDGSKLYVAATGTPYPLRFDDTSAAGSREFSQYGMAFHITTPPDIAY